MPRARLRVTAAVTLMVWLLTGPTGFAQTSGVTANLAGTVYDESGSRLSGVSLTATASERAIARNTVTGVDGTFLIQNLPPGSFTVTANLPGFRSVELPNVMISLGQQAELPIRMRLATQFETLVVIGESSPALDTAKTEMSTLVNERSISELPMNTRNPLQFILTTPATTPQRTFVGSGYSFAGARARNNGSNIDGVNNNNDVVRGFLAQPPLDATQEFQVLTSGYAAEFGNSSGAVVNTILKSGTNNLKGTVYLFTRDRSIAANNFFTNANPNNPSHFKPPYRLQQFGESIGGPIRRNKSFFFGAYERFQLNDSSIVTINPRDADIINNVLAGNYPFVMSLGLNYPRGINLGYKQIDGSGTFPKTTSRHIAVGKLDYQPTASDSLSFRYLLNWMQNRDAGSGLNDQTRNGVLNHSRTDSIGVSYTRVYSPTVLNEMRFLYSNFGLASTPDEPFGPAINILGIGMFGRNIAQPSGQLQVRNELIDNYSLHRHAHLLKFGADMSRVHIRGELPGLAVGPVGAPAGVFTFPNMAGFLDGNAVNFMQGFGEFKTSQVRWHYGLFVQDSMRLSNQVTFNAGIRYELQTNPKVADLLDPTLREINRDSNNFGPRFGLAVNRGRVAVRASYGIYYDLLFGTMTVGLAQFNGLRARTITLTGTDAAARFRGKNFGFPPGVLPSTIPDNVFPLQTILTADPKLPTPYSQQAQLTVERVLTTNFSISASYMLNRGVKYPILRNINLPPPIKSGPRPLYNISQRIPELPDRRVLINNQFEPSGQSTYHGLIVQATKRFSRNFQFNASWTYSHAIDYIADPIFDNPFAQDQLNLKDDRGNSAQDERHRMVFSGVFNVGKFTVAPLLTFGTGYFYNITTGTDSNGDGVFTTDRPIGVGRNTFKGNANFNSDLRVSRTFGIRENVKLQLTGEGFNVFNTTNFTAYNTVWGSGSFPASPSPAFGHPTVSGSGDSPNRTFQLGLRLTF